MARIPDLPIRLAGFIAPSPFPSFVIPVFAMAPEKVRTKGGFQLYIQDKCTGADTTFVNCEIDEHTNTLDSHQNVSIAQFGDITPFADQDSRIFDLVSNGNRLYAFARADGAVLIGHEMDMRSLLLQRFLADEDISPFVMLEIAKFRDDANAIRESAVACRQVMDDHNFELAERWFLDTLRSTSGGERGGGFRAN